MGYNPKPHRPVNDRYAVPTQLLDMIVPGSSRWALPIVVVLHQFLKLNGYHPRMLPDKVLAEQAGCSVQTVARVRPALTRIFDWKRAAGGAYEYTLRPIPGLRSRGVTHIPRRAFHAACRLGAGAVAALIVWASWTDLTGRIHPSAHWHGAASRAHMSPDSLKQAIKQLIAKGILTDPRPPPRRTGGGTEQISIRTSHPQTTLPGDHPHLSPPPDWTNIAEAATARSDPRRSGRKGGIIRWHGHIRPPPPPTRLRVPPKTGSPSLYTPGNYKKASNQTPNGLKPSFKTRQTPCRGSPKPYRLPSAVERRILKTQRSIPDSARLGLTDRQRLDFYRKARDFIPAADCDCLDDHIRGEIAERALIFGEETLISHQAALTAPNCRRQPILNPPGWAWATIKNRARRLTHDYHHCPPPEEPHTPPTPEAAAAHENNMRQMKHNNPGLYRILTRMDATRKETT